MKIAGIRNNSGVNINFGQNKRNSVLKNVLPSAKTALLCSALLYPAVSPGIEIMREENIRNCAVENNADNFSEKRTVLDRQEEKLSWDKIPDYQKLTGLFYTTIVLLMLMNAFTYKGKDENSDDID